MPRCSLGLARFVRCRQWIHSLSALVTAYVGGFLIDRRLAFFLALRVQVLKRQRSGMPVEAIVADADSIRATLLSKPDAAGHVIPEESELVVLSLPAPIENICRRIQF
jgi:hypothetical protein